MRHLVLVNNAGLWASNRYYYKQQRRAGRVRGMAVGTDFHRRGAPEWQQKMGASWGGRRVACSLRDVNQLSARLTKLTEYYKNR
jgi:hypothetical protein